MGFAGRTYQVPCDHGGYSYDQNTDLISPSMFLGPSRNINLHQNGRGKRGGTAKSNSVAFTGAPRILGGFDFRLSATTNKVWAQSDGKIYYNPASPTLLKSGMSTTKKFNFSLMNSELYIADGVSIIQTWDGVAAATSNITTPAADWAATPPIQMMPHSRNASRRMWAIAGNSLYYSVLNNGKDFASAGSGKITFDIQDAFGLVAMAEYGNRIIVFSRTQAFIVVDDDASTANWGYEKAQFVGGAAHWRGVISVDNDLVVMAEDGQIYTVTGANQYGDYRTASLMRPAFIDNYVKANAQLSAIDDFHLAFDRKLRALKMFFVRAGQINVDSALVFFVDRGAAQGWAIHDNQTSTSGYSASCSFEVRESAGTYTIYTGDYSGFIWKLEQSAKNDDNAGYYAGFKTPNLNFGDPRLRKHYRQMRCIMQSQGSYNLSMNTWIDGVLQGATTITMGSVGGVLGSFILGTDVLGGTDFVDGRADLNYIGKRCQFEFYNSNANQDFFISQLLIDFKQMPALF